MDDDVSLSGIRPVAVAPRREMGTCGRCRFAVKDGPDHTCRFGPPQVGFVPMPIIAQAPPGAIVRPGQQAIQGMAIQVYTSWPVVKPEQGCFAFEVKPAVAN